MISTSHVNISFIEVNRFSLISFNLAVFLSIRKLKERRRVDLPHCQMSHGFR